MTTMKMLAAAAVVAAAMTTPALAQDQIHHRSGIHSRSYDSNAYYRGDDWNRRDSGFWPGEVAAGVVGGAVGAAGAIAGGAVGTAGSIATAPFQTRSYGYNSYAYNGNATSFNGPSGFVCQPGTWFRGEDGRRHICQ